MVYSVLQLSSWIIHYVNIYVYIYIYVKNIKIYKKWHAIPSVHVNSHVIYMKLCTAYGKKEF